MTVVEKKSRIESLARTGRLLVRMNQGRPGVSKSDVLYYKMLATYFERILNARAQGKPVVTHTVFFPAEILYAMDIVPMHTEATTWFTALFLGQTADLLAAGAELGLGPEVCSVHRALGGGFALGTLPRPDAVLWSNLVCDNTAKSGELLTKLNQCRGFFLDHPFKHTEEERRYLTGELRDLVAFLEDLTGRKMDWTKLEETVARMDRVIQLLRDIAELRKAVPSPFGPHSFLKLVTGDYLFPGQPEAIEYLETLKGELQAMVAQQKGCLPRERFRLMTMFIPPLYLMTALDRIYAEYGAVTVTEPYFTAWPEGRLDPSKPLESVARKCCMNPPMRMYSPLDEKSVRFFAEAAQAYRVHGAVNFAHITCRGTCAVIKLLKDTLNEVDVPMLNIDCDIFDQTSLSEEDLRVKLEQFFELLEDR